MRNVLLKRRMADLAFRCIAGKCWLGLAAPMAALLLALAPSASAQPPVHYLHRADMPPGAIGLRQLERGGPLGGYFQPVEIRGPEGTQISLAAEGGMVPPKGGPLTAGMLIGHVYRLQVTNIKFREGEEVYPTIELVDRLYPPPGQAARFPIPIELTQEELEYALDGRYVTRVIYVEDPNAALAVADVRGKQRWFEVAPHQDPLEVADRIGRPVAILRMGSRIPSLESPDPRFNYHAPPAIQFEAPPPAAVPRNAGLEPPIEPPAGQQEANYLRRVPATQLR